MDTRATAPLTEHQVLAETTGANIPPTASVATGRVFGLVAHRHPEGATGLENETLAMLLGRALDGVPETARGPGVAVAAVVVPRHRVDPRPELAATPDNSAVIVAAWSL